MARTVPRSGAIAPKGGAMQLSEAQKRVLRTMERIAAEEIQVIRPKGGMAFYCTKKDHSLRGPHWRTLCAMERKGLLESD